MQAADVALEAGRPGAAPRDVLRRVVAHVRTPLHRDGYALVLNSAFTAAAGLAYWIVAANTYSAHAVGVNAALISSMMLLAGIASLNLTNVLVRFLPQARNPLRVIGRCYLAAGAVAALVAIGFVIGIGDWAPRLAFLTRTSTLEAGFVLATVAWCLFVIQDGVLTALGRAVLVPAENAVFSVLKLGLLAASAALLPLYGIFVSWTVAMIVSVVGVNALVFLRLGRRPARSAARAPLRRDGALKRYLVSDYAASLAWLAAVNVIPIVITAEAGATTNAYFALAWTVALPLYAVAGSIGTSLVLHGSDDRASVPDLTRKAALQGLAVMVPAVVLIVLLAPTALSLFGGAYAQKSTTLLRLLALSAIPDLVMTLALCVARVRRRVGRAAALFAVQAGVAIGLTTPLLHSMGITGVGVAWLGSQVLAAAVVLAACSTRFTNAARGRADELRARAADAAGGGRARRRSSATLAERIAAPLGASLERARFARTDSDVIVAVTAPGAGEELAIKVAWSPYGAAALAKELAAVTALRRLGGANGWHARVPEILDHGSIDGHDYLVERALPGVDGRRFARSSGRRRAVRAVALAVSDLYDSTAVERSLGDALLSDLVDRPLAQVAGRYGRGWNRFGALRRELHAALLGRRALVGRVHGDLWLGNALLTPDGATLTGLLDWEASRRGDLPAVDLAHLLLSTRSVADGRPLGLVARRMLDGADGLTAFERTLLAPYLDAPEPLDVRTVVILAWLRHVTLRLSQCTPPRRWFRRNVAPVLEGVS
jgi:O-antigen/teichoic acid export membrane protein/aminoglycoside phosphotransferase